MATVNEKMTALADEIRELSGTTGVMGLDDMANAVHTENVNFESNLSTQDSLIAQIQTAVDNLPDAGSGGGSGGGSIETCTISHSSLLGPGATLYYCDASTQLQSTSTFPVQVLKNSIIASNLAMYASGECTVINAYAIFVYGDCDIILG